MLEFNIRNQEISRIDNFSPAEKSVKYLIAKFNFKTDDWNGAIKRAIFRNVKSKEEKDAMLEDDTCIVPWEVLVGSSDIEVSVHGALDTGDITTNVAVFNLDRTLHGGSASQEPSPTVYEQMLKEMQETKNIAQSVRNDADAGVFDGPQGPKGDAGAVDCRPVDELPTTDIVPSRIYLVKNGTEEIEVNGEKIVKNKYTEYMYIDGEWEIIGSVSIGMNLSEYVKKDDFATNDKHGVSKTNYNKGVTSNNGELEICPANYNIIDKKEDNYRPITAKLLDYAVMKSLSDSKLEWTDEQKQLARALLGVPLVDSNLGIELRDNKLKVVSASKSEINAKSNWVKTLVPATLDYAVKKALSDCKLSGDDAWTEEEKALACSLLNALNLANLGSAFRIASDGKLNLVSASKAQIQLQANAQNPITASVLSYAIKEGLANSKEEWTEEEKAKALELLGGLQKLPTVQESYKTAEVYTNKFNNSTGRNTCELDNYNTAKKFAIPLRNSSGGIYIPDAGIEDDGVIPSGQVAVNRKYVDDLVGSVQSILTELRAHAESLIGGEA